MSVVVKADTHTGVLESVIVFAVEHVHAHSSNITQTHTNTHKHTHTHAHTHACTVMHIPLPALISVACIHPSIPFILSSLVLCSPLLWGKVLHSHCSAECS